MDQRCHDIELVLQREMAGVEKVELGVWQIPEIRSGAISRKYLIVLAPNDQRRRLALAKEGLTLLP